MATIFSINYSTPKQCIAWIMKSSSPQSALISSFSTKVSRHAFRSCILRSKGSEPAKFQALLCQISSTPACIGVARWFGAVNFPTVCPTFMTVELEHNPTSRYVIRTVCSWGYNNLNKYTSAWPCGKFVWRLLLVHLRRLKHWTDFALETTVRDLSSLVRLLVIGTSF